MKKAFAISIAANVLLVGLLFYSFSSRSSVNSNHGMKSSEQGIKRGMENTSGDKAQVAPKGLNPEEIVKTGLKWQMLENEDYPAFIANLRAFGCPEEIVRDIVYSDVNRMYARKYNELNAPPKEYWRDNSIAYGNGDIQQAYKRLGIEQRELLKSLLGWEDVEKEIMKQNTGGEDVDRLQISFLPRGAQDQVLAIQEKHRKMREKFMSEMQGPFTADDNNKLDAINREMAQEIEQALSPEDYEAYILRNSDMARMLRMSLGAFEPSENEYKTIFKMQKPLQDESQRALVKEKDDRVRIGQLQELGVKLDLKIKEALGEERYQEYKRAQDPTYKQTYIVAKSLGMDGKSVALKVTEYSGEIRSQVNKVKSDTTLTEGQKKQQLEILRKNMDEKMKGFFGSQRGYEVYKNQGGWWTDAIFQ